jgi:hypothetical protein
MPGRHVREGVVILHETIHELHWNKLDGILLKRDFKKSYNKVKWPFLQQALRMKGFDPKWCKFLIVLLLKVVLESMLMIT